MAESIQGKKINELNPTGSLTAESLLPVLVVNGTTPVSEATKISIAQLSNYIGNPILIFYSGLSGNVLNISNANKITMLWLNGVLLQNTVDYTLSETTVTFVTSIVTTDKIAILYNFSAPLTLPVASADTLGAVKVDGTTITINDNGIISSNGTTYTAGLGINISNNIISATVQNNVIVDTTNTQITLNPEANKIYEYTQELVSLTISSYTQSYDETVIYFKSGNTPTVINELPEGLSWINGIPTIEANKKYIISIANGLVILGHN